jgi:hypothetical protein
MPSPGGVEFGGILRLILDRVNGAKPSRAGAYQWAELMRRTFGVDATRRSRPPQRGQARTRG